MSSHTVCTLRQRQYTAADQSQELTQCPDQLFDERTFLLQAILVSPSPFQPNRQLTYSRIEPANLRLLSSRPAPWTSPPATNTSKTTSTCCIEWYPLLDSFSTHRIGQGAPSKMTALCLLALIGQNASKRQGGG